MTAITPNEDAIQAATESYMESWALFRDPEYGGSELVRSEYESVVRSVVGLYLRTALADGRITPSDLGLVKADPFGTGHGNGCAHRYGHACDCTARSARYWTLPKRENGSTPPASAHDG